MKLPSLSQRWIAAAIVLLLLGCAAFLYLTTANDLRAMRTESSGQRDGHRAVLPAAGQAAESLAPAWFRHWAAVPDREGEQSIARVAASGELDAAWERFVSLFELLLSISGTLIAALVFLATRSPRPSAPGGATRADLT